jgi:NADH-quinone oxidoreductase subunit J
MFEIAYYATAAIAIATAIAVLLARHPMHGALSLLVSLLALAVLYALLGAPLLAALQVILYAGAIMVLFLFLMMVMNLRSDTAPAGLFRHLKAPALLSLLLLLELAAIFLSLPEEAAHGIMSIGPKAVGLALFGPYLLAVELVAILLLAALVAVLYLSRGDRQTDRERR